jgi:hypothetical protein
MFTEGMRCLLLIKVRGMLTSHSYLEGIVRGYRNQLLTSQNYHNLTQCETIDGTSPLSNQARLLTLDRC